MLSAIARSDGAALGVEELHRQIERQLGKDGEELQKALRRLCQRDLLERDRDSYRFQVELVRRWWASAD